MLDQQTYSVIFHTSTIPTFFEEGLTAKEIEFYCKSYLGNGEWIEAVILEKNYKICYEQE